MNSWQIFKGKGRPHNAMQTFAEDSPPPPWRRFGGKAPPGGSLHVDADLRTRFAAAAFQAKPEEVEIVNAAIHLRRPLLVTGKPGTGKTTLALAIAHELKLGRVLNWSITSRSTLRESLYDYDPIGRLHEVNRRQQRKIEEDPDVGLFIRLGPVGTALLPTTYPRVLLIDEIDKSDIDLPNDLLHVFEEGRYEIPELSRISADKPDVDVLPSGSDDQVTIHEGRVACEAFPIVILTSNGEREFPGPFLRRCVRLNIPEPDDIKLASIVDAYFSGASGLSIKERDDLIAKFLKRRTAGDLSTDQLLNAIYLTRHGFDLENAKPGAQALSETIWKHLSGSSA